MPVVSAAPVLLLEDGLDPRDSAGSGPSRPRPTCCPTAPAPISSPTGGHAFMTDERMARVASFIDAQ